jgi:D-aminopeptidase
MSDSEEEEKYTGMCELCWDQKGYEHKCQKENVRTYVTASIDQIYEELGEMGYNDVLIKWAIEQAIKKHD